MSKHLQAKVRSGNHLRAAPPSEQLLAHGQLPRTPGLRSPGPREGTTLGENTPHPHATLTPRTSCIRMSVISNQGKPNRRQTLGCGAVREIDHDRSALQCLVSNVLKILAGSSEPVVQSKPGKHSVCTNSKSKTFDAQKDSWFPWFRGLVNIQGLANNHCDFKTMLQLSKQQVACEEMQRFGSSPVVAKCQAAIFHPFYCKNSNTHTYIYNYIYIYHL